MPLPQIPPGAGDGSRREHFVYAETPMGKSWHAYLAGPPMWFMVHSSTRTKPCLEVMTGGELKCPKCGGPRQLALKGYVPLYRESDWAPRCVIVPEATRDVVDRIKLHDRVVIGRDASKKDGAWCTKALSPLPLFQSTLRHRNRAVDLTDTLLRMWSIPELTAWYAVTHGQSDSAMSLDKPDQVKSNGQPFDEMHSAAARRYAAPVAPEPQTVNDSMQAALQRAKEREAAHGSRNGKPPPKG